MSKAEHIRNLLKEAGSAGPRAAYQAYFYYFNCQKFYEAHDVLESLWLNERAGPNNNFFKALIQLAGAFVHLQKDRLQPSAALFRLSRSYLRQFPDNHERLDVAETLTLIDRWLVLLEVPGNPFSREAPPQLTMQAV